MGNWFTDDFSGRSTGDTDMAQVERFEDKVREAFQAVMRHAVAGHSRAGMHTFCNDPAHAMHILSDAGIRPVNEGTAHRILDK